MGIPLQLVSDVGPVAISAGPRIKAKLVAASQSNSVGFPRESMRSTAMAQSTASGTHFVAELAVRSRRITAKLTSIKPTR